MSLSIEQLIFFTNLENYDTILVDTCCYTFFKTHRIYNIKNEPKCKLSTLGDNDVWILVR